MKQQSYQVLFKVLVVHSYFEHGKCSCIQFKPKAETVALLKRFNLLIKNHTDGFELYSNAADPAALLDYICSSTGSTGFDFHLITNNEYFNSFTDLPMDWMGQLVYNTQTIKNPSGNGIQELIPEFNAMSIPSSFGSLVVRFEDLKTAIPPSFTINYTARSTQWQYFIINKSAVVLKNPKINGKSTIEFAGPTQVTLETGDQALLFSSDQNLIPLNVTPNYKFDLVDGITGEPPGVGQNQVFKTIVKGLPTPMAANIRQGRTDVKLVSSPMYVYI